jgi:uncharacterized phage protein (TIGR01671 family)
MKREIKFRAWDKKNSKMINYIPVLLLSENAIWTHDLNYFHNTQQWTEDEGMIYDPILMQYTGLKDSKGVEIFEGDIVKYNGFYEGDCFEEEGIGYVLWNEEGHSVCYNDRNGEIVYICSTWDLAKNYGGEVIGNIYEHPELL